MLPMPLNQFVAKPTKNDKLRTIINRSLDFKSKLQKAERFSRSFRINAFFRGALQERFKFTLNKRGCTRHNQVDPQSNKLTHTPKKLQNSVPSADSFCTPKKASTNIYGNNDTRIAGVKFDTVYPSPSHSPTSSSFISAASPTKLEEDISGRTTKRLIDYEAAHAPLFNTTVEQRNKNKLDKFLVDCKATRNQLYHMNRGYWICGENSFYSPNKKPNLGNALNISERVDKNLDRDKDQSSPPSGDTIYFVKNPNADIGAAVQQPSVAVYNTQESLSESPSSSTPDSSVLPAFATRTPLPSKTSHFPIPAFITSVRANQMSEQRLRKLYQANDLVRRTFEVRGISADLSRVVESGFTADMCIKKSFSQCDTLLPESDQVMGVCMYVFMKKYVWVEEIAVEEQYRRCGVGKILVNRMKQVATARSKTILLYALEDAIGFYLSQGFFRITQRKKDQFEVDCKTFEGQYLTWDP